MKRHADIYVGIKIIKMAFIRTGPIVHRAMLSLKMRDCTSPSKCSLNENLAMRLALVPGTWTDISVTNMEKLEKEGILLRKFLQTPLAPEPDAAWLWSMPASVEFSRRLWCLQAAKCTHTEAPQVVRGVYILTATSDFREEKFEVAKDSVSKM